MEMKKYLVTFKFKLPIDMQETVIDNYFKSFNCIIDDEVACKFIKKEKI